MITVVIPVKNRSVDLRRCIESVLKSHENFNEGPLEILVIDDHSEECIESVAEYYKQVRVLKNTGIGPGAARNVGVSNAGKNIIGFIDSDCVADVDWIRRIVGALKDKNVFAVQGNPCLFQKRQNAKLGECEERLYQGLFRSYVEGDRSQQIDTRNCAFRKNLPDLLGAEIFITDMKKAQAEARVCGNSLVSQGVRIHYDHGMKVYHADPSSLWASMKQKIRHGSGRVYVWPRTPSLRHLFIRYYLNPIVKHGVPWWYVVPVHSSFLWGYARARWKSR